MFLWNYANDLSNDSVMKKLKLSTCVMDFTSLALEGTVAYQAWRLGRVKRYLKKSPATTHCLRSWCLTTRFSCSVGQGGLDPTFKIMDFKKSTATWLLSFVVNGSMYRGNRVTRGKVGIDPRYFSLNKYEAEYSLSLEKGLGTRGRRIRRADRRHSSASSSRIQDGFRNYGWSFYGFFSTGESRREIGPVPPRLSAYGLPEPATPTR